MRFARKRRLKQPKIIYPYYIRHQPRRHSSLLVLTLLYSFLSVPAPNHQQCLLLPPFPLFLPARYNLCRHRRRFLYTHCFVLPCASGCPRRRRWRCTTKDVLELARASRDDWGCPGRCRARKRRERGVRESGCWRWRRGWGLPALGRCRNGISIIATAASAAAGTNASDRCGPRRLACATLADA